IVRNLLEQGLPADTPVLEMCQGTTAQESPLSAPLRALPEAIGEAAFTGPVLFIIGRVAGIAMKRSELSHATNAGAVPIVA
ncbi:hypothetical protein ABTH71_20640, partial [Acinetobacter baumannii]